MKICFIASNVDVSNGNGRFAFSLIQSLRDDHGIEPIILIERGERAIMGAKAVLYTKGIFKKFILNPLIIARALKGRGVDVIHAFDAWPWGIWAYLASLLSGVPFGMTIYGTYGVYPLTRPVQSTLLRAAYRRSSLNAAISRVTAGRIQKYMPEARVVVINQGIDIEQYKGAASSRVTPYPYILTVAYMKRRKGYEVAVEAFAELKKKFPDLRYVIRAAGSNPAYFERIKKIAHDLGVAGDIIWLPKLSESELVGVYRNAVAFYLPSISSDPFYFEGFGSVYLEAQACGVPVVTSLGGGQEDALVHGKTGFLVPEGDAHAGAIALEKLLSDSSLHAAYSADAHEFARSMDWKYKAKEYVEHYAKLSSTS